jgi:hypothetical protein
MAERLIELAQGETERDKRTSLQARAQVHATLALAAATAFPPTQTAIGGDWMAVLGGDAP